MNKRLVRKTEPYLWILPSIVLMAIFIIVPIFHVFKMAFSEVSKTGKIRGFAGFDNFETVINSSSFSIVLKNTIIWTILVVVLSTVLPYLLYTGGLACVEPGSASIMASLEPVVAALTGVLVFGEPISATMIAGILCILAGVYILR